MQQMGEEEKGIEWEQRKSGGKGKPCELPCWPGRGEGNVPRWSLSQENLCVFISVCTIYGPAGPVREAGLFWHCEQSYSWDQTLEALGPCQEHTVAMVI